MEREVPDEIEQLLDKYEPYLVGCHLENASKLLLYELPIYLLSEKDFLKKCEKEKEKLIKQFKENGSTEEKAIECFKTVYYPKNLWKYNQIIGCIEIYATNNDIVFELYCTLDKKIPAFSEKKHFAEDWRINGEHFNWNNKSNPEIRKKIIKHLQSVKMMVNRKYYINDEALTVTLPYLNIKGLLDGGDRPN